MDFFLLFTCKKEKFNALDTMLSSCGNSFYEDGSQDELHLMTRENNVAKRLDYSDTILNNSFADVSKVDYFHLHINEDVKPKGKIHDGKLIERLKLFNPKFQFRGFKKSCPLNLNFVFKDFLKEGGNGFLEIRAKFFIKQKFFGKKKIFWKKKMFSELE